MDMPSISSTPRMVEDIFKSFSARRSTIVRVLTSDVNEFYSLCDPVEKGKVAFFLEMGLLSTLKGIIGFGVGACGGVGVGFYLFMYFQPSGVKVQFAGHLCYIR